MTDDWIKILRDSWTIFEIEMEELTSRKRDTLFFLNFLAMYIVVALPLRLFGVKLISEVGATFFAAILNVSFIFQFVDVVMRTVRSGAYEAYMLALKSILSLYLSNFYTIWIFIPIFIMAFLPGVLEAGSLVFDVPMFIVAFILTALSNTSISIVLAGIHIAYKSIRQFRGITRLLLYFFFALGIPYLLWRELWSRVVLMIPQTHSISLMVYSLTAGKVKMTDPTFSILYLLLFSLLTLPLSLKIYRKAEQVAKKYGLTELRPH